jgi:uncharacterized protein related to proFAR isomerase
MEVTPLITMKKRKILDSEELLEKISDDQILYIYDLDGIGRDKPNLCTFQRLSKTQDIWVDSGPRDLGDIVDAFLAGAKAITVRKTLFPKIDLSKVREISENKVFSSIDFDQNKNNYNNRDFDGLINFIDREKMADDFRYSDQLKRFVNQNSVFTYESNIGNLRYWKTLGIDKFLVDLDKVEEFKKHDI